MLLLFWIKSQPGVPYRSVVYKRAFNVFFNYLKMKKITLLNEFIFVFIWYFIGKILLENSCQKQGVGEKDKKEGWPYRGVACRRGFQTC